MKVPRSESKSVEFKTAFNQDTIVSLVAFANADGGSVYIGVRDDGKVIGVPSDGEPETSWVNEIKSKTAPSIVPYAERIAVGSKSVVKLHVASLPVKPTSVQGRYYIRKGKSNHLMSIGELSDLYMKSISSSWDAFPSEYTLDDISLEKVAAFARRMNPDNPDDPLRILRKLSLMKDGKPTNACYLSFVADYCFGTAFQAGRFKTQSHIIDDKTFNSDIISQLDGVMEFVMKHLMGELVITGKPQHDIKYDYPVDAIREIVLNMIVHRDYRNTGMVNTIKIFDDRMEFTNAGGLPQGLTVKKILSDAYTSSPRNPKVADLFRDAGLIERYGSGIKRIVNSCKNHGSVEVSFENHDTWFKVVLHKVIKDVPVNVPVNVPERLAEAMIELISANPGINRIRLARILGVNVKTVGRNITGLAGKVEYRGSPKTGGYYVVDSN